MGKDLSLLKQIKVQEVKDLKEVEVSNGAVILNIQTQVIVAAMRVEGMTLTEA